MTFVIKTNADTESVYASLRESAMKTYVIEAIVDKYMRCIEEVINIPRLIQCFHEMEKKGLVGDILKEIILQSKVEFNLEEE